MTGQFSELSYDSFAHSGSSSTLTKRQTYLLHLLTTCKLQWLIFFSFYSRCYNNYWPGWPIVVVKNPQRKLVLNKDLTRILQQCLLFSFKKSLVLLFSLVDIELSKLTGNTGTTSMWLFNITDGKLGSLPSHVIIAAVTLPESFLCMTVIKKKKVVKP